MTYALPHRVIRGLSPTSRLEAGAPSAIEDAPTRYALPTSRLEAGAPSTRMSGAFCSPLVITAKSSEGTGDAAHGFCEHLPAESEPGGRHEVAWGERSEPQGCCILKIQSPGRGDIISEFPRPAVCRPSGAWGFLIRHSWGSLRSPQAIPCRPPDSISLVEGCQLRCTCFAAVLAGISYTLFALVSCFSDQKV